MVLATQTARVTSCDIGIQCDLSAESQCYCTTVKPPDSLQTEAASIEMEDSEAQSESELEDFDVADLSFDL